MGITASSNTSAISVAQSKRKWYTENLRSSSVNASMYYSNITKDESVITSDKRLRFLCLHGWRTSGEILQIQSSALRAYLQLDCVFLDAPFAAEGSPDSGIAAFYEDMDYFEWYMGGDRLQPTISESLDYILSFIQTHGPFDGLLGFSQGASMATIVAGHLLNKDTNSIKYMILVGGVDPTPGTFKFSPICAKSLHFMGSLDPYKSRSKILLSLYDPDSTTVLEHKEGHNLPSIQTDTYHLAKKWLWEDEGYDYNIASPKINPQQQPN